MNTTLAVKRSRLHANGCPGQKLVRDGEWDSVWVLPELGRVRNGRKHDEYLEWRCNAPDCHASIRVRHEDILVLMPAE